MLARRGVVYPAVRRKRRNLSSSNANLISDKWDTVGWGFYTYKIFCPRAFFIFRKGAFWLIKVGSIRLLAGVSDDVEGVAGWNVSLNNE